MALAPDLAHEPISALDPEVAGRVAARVEGLGYAIIEDVLDAATCASLIEEIDRVEREHDVAFGQNDFEGFRTRRIFNLIARGPRFRDLVIEARVLAAVEAILGEGFLLSGTTSMHIGPGETVQLLHADDGMVSLPRPHPATMVTTLWALSDFTAENGATRLIPASHRREAIVPSVEEEEREAVSAVMRAGSVLVFHASLWHGGGANTTDDVERYGLSIQYVAGWCRQQQNLMLGTPRDVVASYPRKLQELIGYSMYRNVMGHVDREHPLTLLGADVEAEMVWDRLERKR
jgi:ectoine hydroxylase-related dioxygenase (phytanoyl-CoA dioxygenase family)